MVLFVDDATWEAFSALAGALRVRGVGVARATLAANGLRSRALRLLDLPLYGRPRRIGTRDGGPDGGVRVDPAAVRRAMGPRVVDVQAHDDLAKALPADSGLGQLANRIRPGLDPSILTDKWELARFAEAVGVPTPPVWREPRSTEFPVVVKARTGFAGEGVRIVHNRSELDAAVGELGGSCSDRVFMQKHVGAGLVMTGGVARDGELIAGAVWEPEPDPADPTGPSLRLSLCDDPEPLRLTRDLVRALGYRGFFNADWVVDDQGTPLLIDFNARVFGSWPALQAGGVDLIGAYLFELGLGPRPPAPAPADGQVEGVLRFPFPSARSMTDVGRHRRDAVEMIKNRRAWLGRRWSGVSRVKVELAYVQAAWRMRSHRRRKEGAE